MRNRLAELRAERQWTQADVGARLGVSRQTVISLEKGKYDPSLPLAFRIAATFGCRIEDVFDPTEDGAHTEGTTSSTVRRRGSTTT